MNGLPIISLEIQDMKYCIRTALSEHAALMDQSIQRAVEDFCNPDNIDAIVKRKAHDALNAAVSEEVRDFFSYGNGRKAVREAVIHWLDEHYCNDGEGMVEQP